MLEVESLSVRYGRVNAVRGVCLDVRPSEVVGLLGPNGAGKSSILSAIVGLVVPAHGSVIFEGESIVGLPPDSIVRRGISLVPENRRIFQRLTVSDNLRLGTTIRKDAAGVRRDLDHLLDRFPALRTKLTAPAAVLSGGQQQQLAIARALLSRPRLLLLDEPSLGLDPISVDRVFKTLAALRDEGLGVLVAEQNAVKTLEVADRVFVLRTGEVSQSGAAEDLRENMDYEHEYLGGGGRSRADGGS